MTNLEQTELPIFIPFTSDYGFKVTFGNEENTLFLRRAIPALIKSPRPITTIIFDKTVYPGLTKLGRSGIFDLACTDDVGNNYLVEMEVRAKIDFVQRLKFYTFQRFNVLIAKGQKRYDNLPKIYAISLLGQKKSNTIKIFTQKDFNAYKFDENKYDLRTKNTFLYLRTENDTASYYLDPSHNMMARSGNCRCTSPSSSENASGNDSASSTGSTKWTSPGQRRPSATPSPIPRNAQIRTILLK